MINRGKESEETKSLPYKGKFFIIFNTITLQVQNNSIKYCQLINIALHNIAWRGKN